MGISYMKPIFEKTKVDIRYIENENKNKSISIDSLENEKKYNIEISFLGNRNETKNAYNKEEIIKYRNEFSSNYIHSLYKKGMKDCQIIEYIDKCMTFLKNNDIIKKGKIDYYTK